MGDEDDLISAEGLYKTYQMGQMKVPALRGLNIKVKHSEFVAVTGPSGSGKTSLLNLLGLLDAPTRGRLMIDHVEVNGLNESMKSKFRLQKLGFIFQFFNLFQELTAIENVILPAIAMGKKRKEYLLKGTFLLKSLGVGDRLRHYPHQLSGGEQQRVAIARALINDPILLLTDEPTANIDSVTANRIVETFERLNSQKKITIIMVTHEKELAARAHRVLEMRDGMIVSASE